MPNYDLRCSECSAEFTARASIAERTENKVACPECGSNELEAVFKSVYFTVKSDAAPACPNSKSCPSGGCALARG